MPHRPRTMSVVADYVSVTNTRTESICSDGIDLQLGLGAEKMSTPEPVNLEASEGRTKIRIFPPICDGSERDTIVRSFNKVVVRQDREDPYMVINVGLLRTRIQLWMENMPEIEPCIDCSMISGLSPVAKIISAAGLNFYALSKNELTSLDQIETPPNKIIFAQPVKQPSHISYARDLNVGFLTFDSAFELHKIRENYKDATLLIRLNSTKGTDGQIAKYGRNQASCQDILNTARMLGLKVTGVVANLGDKNKMSDIKEYVSTIRNIFSYTKQSLGYSMNTVLVKFNMTLEGGDDEDTFIDAANSLNRIFCTSFGGMPGAKAGSKAKIIVDPGEFFLKDIASACCTVIGTRRIGSKESRRVCYYINESIHQTFSYMRLKANLQYIPTVLIYKAKIKSLKGDVPATIFGYAEDAADVICSECFLPGDMANGDVLCFHGLGPYVKAFSSSFLLNSAVVYYYCTTEDIPKLTEWFPGASILDNIFEM